MEFEKYNQFQLNKNIIADETVQKPIKTELLSTMVDLFFLKANAKQPKQEKNI
jgi:hypothetical protein